MKTEGSLFRTRSAVLGVILLPPIMFAHEIVSARTPRPAVIQSSPKWERVNTEDEDFSVYMPVRPSVYEKERYHHDGVKVTRALIAGAYHNGVVFIARVVEVPELKELSQDKLSGNCPRLADLRKVEGRDIEKQGFNGREYLKQADGYTHTVQCFTTKKRFYIVEAAARDKDAPGVERFLSSLSLGSEKTPERQSDDPGRGHAPAPVEVDAAKTYGEKEVTHPAVIINKPFPSYPPVARAARLEGEVKLRVLFLASGEVGDIEVLKGRGAGLSESATEAAKKIKFLPAEKDGRAVSQRAEVVYHFALR